MGWAWACPCAAALPRATAAAWWSPPGRAVTVRLPDRRSGVTLVRQPPFHYAGGFNPVLVELADALPVQAFTRNYID